MSAQHFVAWDHCDCEHAEGDCWPRGEITCAADAAVDPYTACRFFCDECEYFTPCTDGCDWCHPDEPNPPSGLHCWDGHPASWHDECNGVLWIQDSGLRDCGPEIPGADHRDAPIVVEWTVDGYPQWDYA